MQRIACSERDDWQATAAATGFVFHTEAGDRYWDERACYAFTLDEIERQIEAPTAELNAMCRELVSRAVKDERYLRLLKIPQAYWTFIAASWQRSDPSLYGRFDFQFDGKGPAKLLEYNADTPTSLFEAAVFQWTWLEQAIERQIIPKRADQYNSLHERAHRGLAQDRRRQSHSSRSRHGQCRGPRHSTVSRRCRAARRPHTGADRHQGHRLCRQGALRRSRGPADRPDVQALSVGVDVPRGIRRPSERRIDALDRATVESHSVQQGHPAAAMGDVSEPPEPAAGLFRR